MAQFRRKTFNIDKKMAESKSSSGKSSQGSLSDSGRKFMDTVLSSVMQMGMSGENSDVEIIVEGTSYPCHKIILAAGSPYFKSMFSSGMMESTNNCLELPDMDKKTFEAYREYAYSGKELITMDNVVSLMQAAAILQVDSLQESCEAFLAQEMDTENCLEFFKLAKSYNCKLLLEKCRPYVMEGFNGLWKSKEFEELDLDDIKFIVKDDDLVPIDEEQICEAVLRWIKADLSGRKKYISDLFRHIRLIRISPEYLLQELYQEQLCISNETCRRYLDEARDYHMLPGRQQEFCSSRFHLRNSDDFEEVILVVTEYDMERSGSFYQDGKCMWAYSFNQNKWFTLAAIPIQENPGCGFAMTSFRHDFYLSGGSCKHKNMLRYDAEKNEWTLLEGSMKRGRCNHVSGVVRESVFVLGGINPKAKSDNNVLGSVEEYGINNKKWKTMSELQIPVHSAASFVVGDKIFVVGGVLQDGKYTSAVQMLDVRHQECKVLDVKLPDEVTQPLKVTSFGTFNFLITSKGYLYNIKTKPSLKFEVLKQISPILLPVLGFSHYRGTSVILSGTPNKTETFSKMTLLDLKLTPYRIETVTPCTSTKPKPILACMRGVVNRQFLYHTYFQ